MSTFNNRTTAIKNIKKTETQESIAHTAKNIFSVADLWNIQKQVKTSFARRRNLFV